ncbi:hypothetical protein EYF80_025702 [Liparis tanakae]|uniref:Secreted protein n=1 Tax=Liparis tanakae TaxID=230148 RepID=A0A4Z2HGN6_9TELE|nr:hypothetical protein EYF80_025702 [Liparis tanakae]
MMMMMMMVVVVKMMVMMMVMMMMMVVCLCQCVCCFSVMNIPYPRWPALHETERANPPNQREASAAASPPRSAARYPRGRKAEAQKSRRTEEEHGREL